MGHYYSEKPDVESSPAQVKVTIRGQELSFLSDRGVFSRGDLDFGTRTLLEAFELPETEGPIADIGCGWGPIGITLASEFRGRSFLMGDINERAVSLAKRNAEKNGVSGNTDIIVSSLFSAVDTEGFAAILTNPPIRAGKQVVHQLFEDAFSRLKGGGDLWVVIRKKQGAPSAGKKLEELFGDGQVQVVTKEKGYFIFRAQKV
ncbi:class I SAM-dependent methyltransferase [Alteribacter natronophilus]|uniref:class I SAM-dependent methyltransferase n=1 Tax=Alteribacter natronophilus TaxID=2583810 RepID=UPI00110E91C8|nr:class I SAM-dependent methyltransferase [Alteribacter natronophilus]TMW70017.1 class I SAM-dependent methyltransferase [Alteribacter natronophilus]